MIAHWPKSKWKEFSGNIPRLATSRYSQKKKLIGDGCPRKFADLLGRNEPESQKPETLKRQINKRLAPPINRPKAPAGLVWGGQLEIGADPDPMCNWDGKGY